MRKSGSVRKAEVVVVLACWSRSECGVEARCWALARRLGVRRRRSARWRIGRHGRGVLPRQIEIWRIPLRLRPWRPAAVLVLV